MMPAVGWDDGRPLATREAAGHQWWSDLPAGTIVRRRGTSARYLVHSMQGDFAAVYRVRKDGQRDQRYLGWSGGLRVDSYEVLSIGGSDG